MKKRLAISLGVLFSTYIVATPYITVYQIKSSVNAKDGEALSEHIDFPSVRQSLKDQMNAMLMEKMQSDEMKNNPFSAIGMALAGTMVDKMVEAYITPSGISQLMSGENPVKKSSDNSAVGQKSTPEDSKNKNALANISMSYKSMSKFEIIAENKPSESAKFILRRQGLEWKLTEIILPKQP